MTTTINLESIKEADKHIGWVMNEMTHSALTNVSWIKVFYLLTHNNIESFKPDYNNQDDQRVVNLIIKIIMIWIYYAYKEMHYTSDAATIFYRLGMINFMIDKLYKIIGGFAKISFVDTGCVCVFKIKVNDCTMYYEFGGHVFKVISKNDMIKAEKMSHSYRFAKLTQMEYIKQ